MGSAGVFSPQRAEIRMPPASASAAVTGVPFGILSCRRRGTRMEATARSSTSGKSRPEEIKICAPPRQRGEVPDIGGEAVLADEGYREAPPPQTTAWLSGACLLPSVTSRMSAAPAGRGTEVNDKAALARPPKWLLHLHLCGFDHLLSAGHLMRRKASCRARQETKEAAPLSAIARCVAAWTCEACPAASKNLS
jgi:hypothetical protein